MEKKLLQAIDMKPEQKCTKKVQLQVYIGAIDEYCNKPAVEEVNGQPRCRKHYSKWKKKMDKQSSTK